MSLPKVFATTILLSTLGFAAAGRAQTDATASTSANVSKVRIVRLSEVKGDVLMDRAIGRGMEAANANLPIVEQSKLQTAAGAAEVELEDNSSVRLGPGAQIEFPKLERMPNGSTVSWARLITGTAYVSLLKSNNQFTLLFGEQRVTLPAPSHVRLEMGEGAAKLAVLDGNLQVQGPTGMVDVTKKHTATFNLATAGEMTVAGGVSSGPLDEWDKVSSGYHSRMAVVSSMNNSPYAFGSSDLSYYGDFSNAGGCGMMWRPYFASAAWSPYSNGSWAWYGAAGGYSWVSPYPWGWTPYHSGSWNLCPGTGWGWMPGGNWMGLNNMAGIAPGGTTSGPGGPPMRPFRPPAPGEVTIIPVNQRPLVRSEVASEESFVFRKDSAGMGIPRDQLGKLDHFSQHAMMHGTATTEIYMSGPRLTGGTAGNGRGFSGAEPVGTTIHRGGPPAQNDATFGRPIQNQGPPSNSGMPGRSTAPPPATASPAPAPGRPR